MEIKDEHGQVIGTEQVTDEDDGPMFDLMPIEMGSFNLLPQGFRFKTWDRVPVGQQYDLFIGALMREIFRPLLVPYNMGIGSSKDSNMASGVLDAGLYTKGQTAERFAFEDDVLEPLAESWYEIGCLTDSYFTERGFMPASKRELPDHEFGWDKVNHRGRYDRQRTGATAPEKRAVALLTPARKEFTFFTRPCQQRDTNYF